MLNVIGRHAGLVVALLVAVLWWFLPSVEIALFAANQKFLYGVAYILPSPVGTFLSSLIDLVQALQAALSAPKFFMPNAIAAHFQATIAVIVNTLLVLGEIKMIRLVLKVVGFCRKLLSGQRGKVHQRTDPKFG